MVAVGFALSFATAQERLRPAFVSQVLAPEQSVILPLLRSSDGGELQLSSGWRGAVAID
jgi:hypothetical protein